MCVCVSRWFIIFCCILWTESCCASKMQHVEPKAQTCHNLWPSDIWNKKRYGTNI